MAPLRLVFMATPEFALPSLAALVEAGHELLCVYTQPPRRAGRGQAPRPSPVQRAAEERGIAVRCPASIKAAAEQNAFAALAADVAVVVAYGLILPPPILAAPRLGCINVHASLLPRWRGAAPIQRAIMAGDDRTGVSIMQMDEGLDTGGVLLAEQVASGARDTGGELHHRLAELGARLLVEVLALRAEGRIVAKKQPEEGVTYAAKLDRGDGAIDWRRPARELDCLVRALNPAPGAWFRVGGDGGERVRVLDAELRPRVTGSTPGTAAGTVLDDRLTIACGSGALGLLRVQRQGRKAMDADAFLRGFELAPGAVLDSPADDAT